MPRCIDLAEGLGVRLRRRLEMGDRGEASPHEARRRGRADGRDRRKRGVAQGKVREVRVSLKTRHAPLCTLQVCGSSRRRPTNLGSEPK